MHGGWIEVECDRLANARLHIAAEACGYFCWLPSNATRKSVSNKRPTTATFPPTVSSAAFLAASKREDGQIVNNSADLFGWVVQLASHFGRIYQ